MIKFFEHLRGVLSRDARFIDADGEKLLRNKISEAATLYDEKLLTLLLADEKTRETFFTDAAGVTVFKQRDFVQVVNGHEFLANSYTRFANKIGLVDEHDRFVSRTGNVALVFPYKDCVLEGGQTKDDQKRDEIFYNTTLAHDELDRLLAPKVFTNAVRYDEHGATPATDFSDADNLIVKGNNLLALASLAERFSGKVKAIYLDPPYNTGSDGFNYNDSFNHSTWLTFMTNRLTLARQLLADDGSIWISIDDDEQAYLKVLADEIFKRDNFVAAVHWHKNYASANDSKTFSTVLDCILVYRKSASFARNLLPRTEKQNHLYKYDSNDGMGRWRPDNLSVKTYSAAYDYPITNPKTGVVYTPPKGRCWITNRETVQQWIRDGRIFFGQKGDGAPQLKRYLNEVQDGVVPTTYWSYDDCGHNDEARKEIKALFNKNLFSTPKPERLLERILTLATKAGDLVLDFFLGSGTTAAVAHKMGRRYIGVEQLDYVQTLTVERLKKVIGGEQGGISTRVGWQGGGSFVYCELARLNQAFVEEIARATDTATLEDLRGRIVSTGYISHKVDAAQIDADAFAALTLDEQKRALMALLDMNMLYVNLCDMDDADFATSDADKQFTRNFYCP